MKGWIQPYGKSIHLLTLCFLSLPLHTWAQLEFQPFWCVRIRTSKIINCDDHTSYNINFSRHVNFTPSPLATYALPPPPPYVHPAGPVVRGGFFCLIFFLFFFPNWQWSLNSIWGFFLLLFFFVSVVSTQPLSFLPPSVRWEVKGLSELLLCLLWHFSDILIFWKNFKVNI